MLTNKMLKYNLPALLVAQRRPIDDLFKSAQTTAAHVIAQYGGAMANTGAFCGDFFAV
jgi:hypothetical protein